MLPLNDFEDVTWFYKRCTNCECLDAKGVWGTVISELSSMGKSPKKDPVACKNTIIDTVQSERDNEKTMEVIGADSGPPQVMGTQRVLGSTRSRDEIYGPNKQSSKGSKNMHPEEASAKRSLKMDQMVDPLSLVLGENDFNKGLTRDEKATGSV